MALAYAPPVCRDGSKYNGLRFYVTIDETHHIERSDTGTLFQNLTAKLGISFVPTTGNTDSNRTNIYYYEGNLVEMTARKDQTVHYFRAQLLHYGLPPLKTKAAAKKVLLAAIMEISNGILVVPRHILNLERQLMGEWATANEEAKRKYEQMKCQQTPKPVPTGDHRTKTKTKKREKSIVEGVDLLEDESEHTTEKSKKSKKRKSSGCVGHDRKDAYVVCAVRSGRVEEDRLRDIVCEVLNGDGDSDELRAAIRKEILREDKMRVQKRRKKQPTMIENYHQWR